MTELVLVTGGSGFVGSYCILKLLEAGYRVRTTVRYLSREAEVRKMLKWGGAEPGDALSFVEADLNSNLGWSEAVADCDYVLHVASPFPSSAPADENELIIPARDGALRVLRAARDAGVKRVVLTSSFAAIGYGHEPSSQPFTEETWTDLEGPGITAYVKSKVLAERAAWDFIAKEGGALELVVINPVGIFGPVLVEDYSSSIQMIDRLLNGTVFPHLSFGVVDVRDVADIHVRAMTNPAAKGQRFLATAGLLTIEEVGQLLKSRLGTKASQISQRNMPDWFVKLVGFISPTARRLSSDLNQKRYSSSEKAQRLLGWQPRPKEDTLVETARSLIALSQRDDDDEPEIESETDST